MLKDVIYDDVSNGLLFLETGVIVYRKEYLDTRDSILFSRYNREVDGSGIIYDIITKQRLGFLKYNIPYFNRVGLLKLGNMDIHMNGKVEFERKITNYLINNKIDDIDINLDGGLDGLNIFFLKYIKDEDVLNKILWSINRHKHVVLKLKLYNNKIIYSKGNPDEFIRCYSTNDFLKKYETMGLEVAPPIEETKPVGFPELAIDKLSELLNSFKDKSLTRAKPTTNDFSFNYCIHPKTFKRTDKIEPFRRPTGGTRCTMTKIDEGLMEEIKNLDAEELYPKTTTINNLSIHDDKIIEAYEQFLNMIFDKEKYDGISIRVPKECEDDWFEILPCFKYVRNLAYKITPELDLYVNIRKLDNNSGNYVIDISGTDYTTANINNNRLQFSESDKVLTIDIYNLQTRLVDIIQDIKSPIVGQGDEVKLGNKISSELKDTGSRTQIRYDNDGTSGATLMRCYNNLLRGLPFDHIDNFDFEGDTIMNEIKFKNELSGLKEPNPTDLSDWVNNNSSNFDKNFKHINLGGVDTMFSATSLLKRLPIVSKYGVNDVVSDSEIKTLNGLYNNYIVSSDNLTFDYVNKLNEKYNHIFKHHIEIGILYPKLKFNYEYGYYLNDNFTIEYGVVRSNVVPFEYMISKEPINIYKDIEYKYNIFVSTQANLCHAQNSIDGVQLLDIYQADKCKGIYRTIFSKYIELGVLKDTLELITVRPDKYYKFSAVDDIYK